MSGTSFRVNLQSTVYLNLKELLYRSRCHIWSLTDNNEIWTHNHLFRNRSLKHLAKLAKKLSYSMVCLNLKGLHAWRRHHIWSLSDTNGIRSHDHLVSKQINKQISKQISTHNTAQLFGQSVYVVEWSFTN